MNPFNAFFLDYASADTEPSEVEPMTLADILLLYSCDSSVYGYRNMTVAEVLPQVDISSTYHRDLKKRMTELGINIVPVLVYRHSRSLGNGHHRVKIAYELGWTQMRITRNGEESGWRPDLKDVIL